MKMSIKNFLAVITLMAVVGGSTVSGMIPSSIGGDKQDQNENNGKKRKLGKNQKKKENKKRKITKKAMEKATLLEVIGQSIPNDKKQEKPLSSTNVVKLDDKELQAVKLFVGEIIDNNTVKPTDKPVVELQPAVQPVNEQVIIDKSAQDVPNDIKLIKLNIEVEDLKKMKQELLEKQKDNEEKGSNNESNFINKIKVGGSMLAGALVLSTSLYCGSGYDTNAFTEVYLIAGALLGLGANKVYAYFVPKK